MIMLKIIVKQTCEPDVEADNDNKPYKPVMLLCDVRVQI